MQRREPMFISDDFSMPLDAFVLPPQYKAGGSRANAIRAHRRAAAPFTRFDGLQDYISHVLLPHGTIIDRIEKLAADIRADYADSTPHFLVVLKVPQQFMARSCATRQACA
jgi:hypothetical protein